MIANWVDGWEMKSLEKVERQWMRKPFTNKYGKKKKKKKKKKVNNERI